MAKLSRTRYQGGPLSDYGGSFTGLKQFYKLQQPGETQHEQLQNEAVNQQRAAGGFYRPGFEPQPPPSAPILTPPPPVAPAAPSFGPDVMRSPVAGQENVLELKPNQYGSGFSANAIAPSLSIPAPEDTGYNEDEYQARKAAGLPPRAGEPGWLDIPGTIPQKPPASAPSRAPLSIDYSGETFARPVGMTSESPPILGGGQVPAGGRSMTDPSRLVETAARRNRGDARTQMAAAGFLQQQQSAPAQAEWERYKFEQAQAGLDNRSAASIAAANQRAADTNQRLINKDATDFQQGLYKQNYEETLKQLAEQRNREAAGQSYSVFDPTTGKVDPNHFRTGTNVILPTSAPKPIQETFPGSGVYVNPAVPNSGKATLERPAATANIPWMGPAAGPMGVAASTLAVPTPPQFKALPTGKDKPPTPLELITQMGKLDVIINGKGDGTVTTADAETVKRAKLEKAKLMKAYDTNGDGKLSPEEIARATGGAGGGTGKPAPTSGFLNAVK